MAGQAFGRYQLYRAFAQGGMASIHVARLRLASGFDRIVAVKRVSPSLAQNERNHRMLLEEARISGRVSSPYVVSIFDVIHEPPKRLGIVMEIIRGVSLGTLLGAMAEQEERVPPAVAVAILADALRGLHAAHEATDLDGSPLQVVHRDVSPNNLIVGANGVTRVVDFGIAKALGAEELTLTGEVKGKLGYMPPEQLQGRVTRQADIYAAGIVLWEMLVGVRLRPDDRDQAVDDLRKGVPSPRSKVATIPTALDEVVMTAVAREPAKRFATAEAMAIALEEACAPASHEQVAAFVERHGYDALVAFDEACKEAAEDESTIVTALPTADAAPPPEPAVVPDRPQPPQLATPAASATSRRLVGVGIAAALLIGIGVGVMFGGGGKRDDAAPLAALPDAGRVELAESPPAAAASASFPGIAIAEVPAPPEPSATPVPSASVAPRASAVTASPPRPRTVPSKAWCTPPYTYDANGRKHYKRECLP